MVQCVINNWGERMSGRTKGIKIEVSNTSACQLICCCLLMVMTLVIINKSQDEYIYIKSRHFSSLTDCIVVFVELFFPSKFVCDCLKNLGGFFSALFYLLQQDHSTNGAGVGFCTPP